MIRAGVATPQRIVASDPLPAAREEFARLTDARAIESNTSVVEGSDVLILAVKPQSIAALLAEIEPVVAVSHLVVSIAAGISFGVITTGLRGHGRVVRVMPNTPALIGAGAAGYCVGPDATAEDESLVRSMLNSVGVCHAVPESLLDAVTALAGSGPAFVFTMIEALADGGVRVGLPREVALSLAAQTVAGAARLVQESGEPPAVLRDRVASPGGTTIAGLHALESGGVRAAFMNAIVAATARAAEIASQATKPPTAS
jgi:pyrroline-5-carboxylate reductase